MEHRYTERTASELKILIYKHNHPIAIGRVKNGSYSGIFVETDFVDIDCEHQLTLEIFPRKNQLTKFQRIEMQAIVIPKTNKGFGAEVDFADSIQMASFIEVLRSPQLAAPDEYIFAMAANV